MLKVTVVVSTSDASGHSEEFRAELPGPMGLQLSGHAPIYAEQLIAEVGAHLVRKVAAVYGDHRDDPVTATKLPRLRLLRPLTDFDEAREAARQGVLSPGFRLGVDRGSDLATAIEESRKGIEQAMKRFLDGIADGLRILKQEQEEKADGEKSTAG
ncbi:MAG: hypothetical protein ACRD0P_14335 [Stackebrandtia sp.]